MSKSLMALLCVLLMGGLAPAIASLDNPTPSEATAMNRAQELARVRQPLAKGKQRLLYVLPYGDREQVRLRVTPYDAGQGRGGDAVGDANRR